MLTGLEYYPVVDVQIDEQILEVARSSVVTVWHACRTCEMGAFERCDGDGGFAGDGPWVWGD